MRSFAAILLQLCDTIKLHMLGKPSAFLQHTPAVLLM